MSELRNPISRATCGSSGIPIRAACGATRIVVTAVLGRLLFAEALSLRKRGGLVVAAAAMVTLAFTRSSWRRSASDTSKLA